MPPNREGDCTEIPFQKIAQTARPERFFGITNSSLRNGVGDEKQRSKAVT